MQRVRDYNTLIESVKNKLESVKDVVVLLYGSVKERNKEYLLYKIQSSSLSRRDRLLIITTGFHGEEPAGPLTIAHYARKIIHYAQKKKVKVVIYPCINPSGFEYNKRYNLSDEDPNNFFLYYQIAPGIFASEIAPYIHFQKAIYIHKTFLKKRMAKESLMLIKDIEKLFERATPRGILDIHQDNESPLRNGFYISIHALHKRPYINLIKRTAWKAKIVKNALLDPETNHVLDSPKNNFGVITPVDIAKRLKKYWQTDEYGILDIRDGTITDFLNQEGVKHAIAIETDVALSLKKARKINFMWIKGIIDLISKGK